MMVGRADFEQSNENHFKTTLLAQGAGEISPFDNKNEFSAQPAPDQSEFDRELALLREANAVVYARRTAWRVKR
jgi:hypothetical protein